jgi:ADP-ribose pyrophosphatase YjhB (NUDIX family)
VKRSYPSRPLVGVGAVIRKGQRVVVVRRKAPPLKGRWSIPGGLVDVGESLRQAVVREAREETGLTVSVGKLVEVFERILPGARGRTKYHFVLLDYLCRPLKGTLRAGSDASEVRWVTRREFERLPMVESAKRVLRRALGAKAKVKSTKEKGKSSR